MAFRGGVATATVVDTRYEPTGPGVRIFTDSTDYTNEQGVVEFTPGGAVVTEHYAMNPRAENSIQSGGLRLGGGSYGGAAPALDLAVVLNGDGSTSSEAILTGGALTLDRPATVTDAGGSWRQLPLTGAFTNWDLAANQCLYRHDASGELHIRGIAKLPTGSAGIGVNSSATVATLPAGFYLPGAYGWRVVALLNASGVCVGMAQAYLADASLVVANTTATTAGAGFGFCIGLSFPTT